MDHPIVNALFTLLGAVIGIYLFRLIRKADRFGGRPRRPSNFEMEKREEELR